MNSAARQSDNRTSPFGLPHFVDETTPEFPQIRCHMLPTFLPRVRSIVFTLCLGCFAQIVFAQADESVAQPAEPVAPPPVQIAPDDEGIETLTRGALHEAFADQADQNLVKGVLAPKAPPEPIEELPPEIKPEGDDIEWIPGYWYWDDERKDFIWISGVWRKIPPGQQWVPGYWTEVDGEYRRVSGVWSRGAVSSLEYLPYPPESLERGPASPAPADDCFWVPGNWVYYNNGYSWRPGHWERYRNDWVWSPSRYVWSPSGCVYQPGYWDYPFASRGQLYCPVYFQNHVYRQPNYRFRPCVTIRTSSIFLHLFVRSGHNHYYFGNYYGNEHRNHYHPWYDYQRVGRRYDPLITHARGRSHHAGIDYVKRMRDWNHYFTNHSDHRPPSTIKHQRDFEHHHKNFSQINHVALGRSIKQTLHEQDSRVRSHRTSPTQQDRIHRRVAEVGKLTESRRHQESNLSSDSPLWRGPRAGIASATERLSGRFTSDDDDINRKKTRDRAESSTKSHIVDGTHKKNRPGDGKTKASGIESERRDGLSSGGLAGSNEDRQRESQLRRNRIQKGTINRVGATRTTSNDDKAGRAISKTRQSQPAKPSTPAPRPTISPAIEKLKPGLSLQSRIQSQSQSRTQSTRPSTPAARPTYRRNVPVGPTRPRPAVSAPKPSTRTRSTPSTRTRSTPAAAQPSYRRSVPVGPTRPMSAVSTPKPSRPAPRPTRSSSIERLKPGLSLQPRSRP